MPAAAALVRAYIGIGSNMDEPVTHVVQAIAELDDIPGCCCVRYSSLYRTAPMGPTDQADFINAVAAVDTTLTALQLFERLQDLERRHGRVRSEPRWGPRSLDLDLLIYGAARIDGWDLTVPHPGMLQRDFVLYPLHEIAPDLQLPDHGPIADHLPQCISHGLERLGIPT